MASTCDIYKGSIKIGSGQIAAGSYNITSFVAVPGTPPIARRNVTVHITQAGTHLGRTMNTRIVADNGAGTLTMKDPSPHVGA